MGADIDQLGKQSDVERLAQERDAVAAAGAALEADDALDRLHVPEAPELEVFLDVDQLLAHVIAVPVLPGIVVNQLENANHAGMPLVGLRPVEIDALLGHCHDAACEVAHKLIQYT